MSRLWGSRAAGDGLALAAGASLPLAFAPYGVAPLALVSPALVFLAWIDASPRRAAWRGWLFGCGAFGVGVSWIRESFQFSHIPGPLALFLTAGFVAFLAVYPAVLGYALRRLPLGGKRLRLALAFPAGWVLFEWLRGWLLTGFTWLQLGYSQLDSPLAGWFPVVGVYGVGWIVAASAGTVALAVHGRRAPWPWLAVCAALWAGGGGLARIHWSTPGDETLSVALIQGNVPQHEKWLPRMKQPTLDRYLSLTRRHWAAGLVVWPETALPGFYHALEGFVRELAAEAAANNSNVLFGVPVLEASRGRYLNSVLLVGDTPGFYHKRHLVPFGEYLPLRPLLGRVTDALGIKVARFSPGGASQTPLTVRGFGLGVFVCYEITFGSEVIRAFPQADILVTVSNDAWFGDTAGPHQHLEIARARALETGRYVVRATNTGISAIITPRGDIQARLPQFERGALAGEVRRMRGTTPYVRAGDGPVIAGLFLALGIVLLLGRRCGTHANTEARSV